MIHLQNFHPLRILAGIYHLPTCIASSPNKIQLYNLCVSQTRDATPQKIQNLRGAKIVSGAEQSFRDVDILEFNSWFGLVAKLEV